MFSSDRLVFSQSILSLDLIELFLKYKTEEVGEVKTKPKKVSALKRLFRPGVESGYVGNIYSILFLTNNV